MESKKILYNKLIINIFSVLSNFIASNKKVTVI